MTDQQLRKPEYCTDLIRDDKEKLSKTFSSIYVLQLLTSAISVTAYVIYLVWIIDANRTVALVQGVYLMSAAFDINWFFFGLEKFKLTVTRNMVIRILSLVGIFVFVKDQSDLILYLSLIHISEPTRPY